MFIYIYLQIYPNQHASAYDHIIHITESGGTHLCILRYSSEIRDLLYYMGLQTGPPNPAWRINTPWAPSPRRSLRLCRHRPGLIDGRSLVPDPKLFVVCMFPARY